jgi:hypothetical protein
MSPRNFDPMRHEWWPGIVAMFYGEWTREAAMMDLRWYAVEARVFRKAFPSRRQLMPRWGWTERRVRDLLASPGEWQDPMHPMSMEELRGEKVPTRSQQGPSEVPTMSHAEPTNANNRAERSQRGPNEVPVTSQQGPHARGSQSPPPTTDHRQGIQEGEAAHAAPVPREPRKPDDVDALHAVYRGHRPRTSATPTPDSRKALTRILGECDGKLDVAGLYLAWVFQSDDQHAQQLRGELPWIDGKVIARCDVVSLSRNIPPRLAAAEAWDARGRREAPQVVALRPAQGARNGRGTLASDLFTDDDLDTPARPHAVDAAWSSV